MLIYMQVFGIVLGQRMFNMFQDVSNGQNWGFNCRVVGMYLMEDWLMWTMFYSGPVLGEVLLNALPKMAEAWDYLKRATVFYLKGKAILQESSYESRKRSFDEHREEARQNMRRHANLMETFGPAYMMTLNLRLLVVHLHMYASTFAH
jgi:hypothetical protein